MRAFIWLVAALIGGCAAGTASDDLRGDGGDPVGADAAALRVTVDGRGHVTYENTSSRSAWVTGYAPDRPFYQLQTLDPQRWVWRDQVAWCGTGSAAHEVRPGESHRFPIAVSPRVKGKVYRVVVRYSESPSGAGPVVAASAIGMD